MSTWIDSDDRLPNKLQDVWVKLNPDRQPFIARFLVCEFAPFGVDSWCVLTSEKRKNFHRVAYPFLWQPVPDPT